MVEAINPNEPYMILQDWIYAGCPTGIWTTIKRQEDIHRVDENTGNLLASACIQAIKNYGNGKPFECRGLFSLAFIEDRYEFTFDGHPFTAFRTKGYINSDLIDVIQVATTFRIHGNDDDPPKSVL